MAQGFWKVYRAKVLQTLGGELQEDDLQDERNQEVTRAPTRARSNLPPAPEKESPELMETTDSTLLTEEGSNPVSQLARRVQGAGAKSWKTMSSLFAREDEHKLLASEPCADHPLAAKPVEDSISEKMSGLWDVFATKWQQMPALEKMSAKVDTRERTDEGGGSEPCGETDTEEASCTSPDNDLREAEGVAFKWSFLTSKLAEMKNKNVPKGN